MDSKNIKLQKQIEDIVTTILPVTKSDNVQYKDSTVTEEVQIKGIELMDYTEYADLAEKKQNVPYFIRKSTAPHYNLNLQYNDEVVVTYALDDYEGLSDIYTNTQNHIVNLYDESSYGVKNGVLWFIDEEGTMRMFGTLTASMNDIDLEQAVYENYIYDITNVYANFNPTDASLAGQFMLLGAATKIEFGSRFNTRLTTNMFAMFCGCRSLSALNISNFDTKNVADVSFMFEGCANLTNLDLGEFDTSNVTYMGGMFVGCSSLTNLDLSNFDTSKVTDMNSMFSYCSSLTSLDVSNFNTSNVTDMSSMFCSCESLTDLDVSSFNTSKVTTMHLMFHYCLSLKALDLSHFDTSKVTDMGYMFHGCIELDTLDISSFNTSKVADMSNMFGGIVLISGSTSQPAGMYGIPLTSLDLSHFNCSSVQDMSYMFNWMTNVFDLTLPQNLPDLSDSNSAKLPVTFSDDDDVIYNADTKINASMSGKHFFRLR